MGTYAPGESLGVLRALFNSTRIASIMSRTVPNSSIAPSTNSAVDDPGSTYNATHIRHLRQEYQGTLLVTFERSIQTQCTASSATGCSHNGGRQATYTYLPTPPLLDAKVTAASPRPFPWQPLPHSPSVAACSFPAPPADAPIWQAANIHNHPKTRRLA